MGKVAVRSWPGAKVGGTRNGVAQKNIEYCTGNGAVHGNAQLRQFYITRRQ